jgi:hypothetical protein
MGPSRLPSSSPPPKEGGEWWQVESITFGWITNNPFGTTAEQKAAGYIRDAVAGKFDDGVEGGVAMKCEPCDVETPEQHGRCQHCA